MRYVNQWLHGSSGNIWKRQERIDLTQFSYSPSLSSLSSLSSCTRSAGLLCTAQGQIPDMLWQKGFKMQGEL